MSDKITEGERTLAKGLGCVAGLFSMVTFLVGLLLGLWWNS